MARAHAPPVKNFEVARLFDRMAEVLELRGENVFRIRAYRRAAQNLETLAEDVEVLANQDRLEEIPGIGQDLAGKIVEYLETGRIKDIEAASRKVPPGVLTLLQIPGIGPKTARALYEKEGITSLERLEKLARAGRLRGRQGIQAKTEANILKGIALVRGGQERVALGRALPLGRELVGALERLPDVKQAVLAGSARRMRDTVGDLDILVTSARAAPIMQVFVALPQVAEVIEQGPTKASIRHRDGIQVDLRVVAYWRCLSAACPAQLKERLRHFASRRAMDIEHLGQATIDQLVRRRLVRDVADLYRLTLTQAASLEGFAARSARNLVEAIQASRGRGLACLLHALGIRLVGEHVARLLAARYGSLDRLSRASAEALGAIPGVGPVIAESVVKFFGEVGNRGLLERLQAAGVATTEPKAAGRPGPLAGQTFVLTGALRRFTREDARARIEALGGRVADAVSRGTSHLVVGEAPGSKLATARRLGVSTMGEDELLRMVGRA